MSRRALLVVAVVLAVSLAGCSGGKKKAEPELVLPEEITQRDLERLENLVSTDPTLFGFPGQAALPPVLDLWFNGTLAPGTGSGGIELPNDDGPVDYGAEIVPFDLATHVPVGQPVEVRAVLKWWGDPGTSADIDIWADMPGTKGADDPKRYDESLNWNVINKQRVLNAVHVEGQPFQVGLQVTNGRIVHPDGVDYAMRVELHFVQDVLAPGVPYAIQVPDNSSILVVDTERVVGDEHVDLEMVLIGPDDRLVRHLVHNDIGVETLSLTVPGGGEYVVYAHSMHGGFLRIEAQVPNPDFMARPLALTVEEKVLFAGPQPAPGTYAEQGQGSGVQTGSNTFGETGSFDVGPAFPLDLVPFMRAEAGPADVALNVTSPNGWYGTGYSCRAMKAPNLTQRVPYCASYQDDGGRVGSPLMQVYDRGTITTGTYTYGLVANGPGVTLGVQVIGYTR